MRTDKPMTAREAALAVGWLNGDGCPFRHREYGSWCVGYSGGTYGGTTAETVRRYYLLQGRLDEAEAVTL
jgi:succinate dehydrogenase/fumarate reductase flavoprotein subunit